jgi:hypothetical protein
MRRPIIPALVILVCAISGSAFAQETREAQIAEAQAEKAKQLTPYQPSPGEVLTIKVDRFLNQLRSGFYPNVGSVYNGGGFAIGPGYRRFFGDRAFWDFRTLYSIRSYKLIELAAISPGHAQNRVDLFAYGSWMDATRVPFYGIGMDTLQTERANFQMQQSSLMAGARVRPVRWVVGNVTASVEDFAIPRTPVPAAEPMYVHTSAMAGLDSRPSPAYARSGNFAGITYHNYADRDRTYSFDRLDAEVIQHVPILRENWVLSFRGRMQTTLDDEDVVPYFLLPSLGSGSTLRAYRSFRFRDRHSELFSAEWRWIPNRLGLDMALFYDAGKVTARRSDLDLKGLKSDVGIGARFHGPAATALRIELARGSEGFHLVFAAGAAF